MNKMEWYEVENTGWSDGHSWFAVDKSRYEPRRFKSALEASEYIKAAPSRRDLSIKWRYVRVTIEQTGNKEVRTREWTEI